MKEKERPSFLQKRSKKLLLIKVFWFFFSKKNALS